MKTKLNENQVDLYFKKAKELEEKVICKNCKTKSMVFEPVDDVFHCTKCNHEQKNTELENYYKKLKGKKWIKTQ